MTTKPKTRIAPAPQASALAQAIALHKAAQAPIDARFGQIDDDAMANQLFTAEGDALKVVAETPCASDAEFVEKLRYLLAHEARIFGAPTGGHEFGSIAVAVDRHFNVDRDFAQAPIGESGQDWGRA